LITGDRCRWGCDTSIEFALSSFLRLKRLAWIGMVSRQHINDIAAVLPQISHQLIELDIDLVFHSIAYYNGEVAPDIDDDHVVTACDVVGIPERAVQKFTNLRTLSLSGLSFIPRASDAHHPHESTENREHIMQESKQLLALLDFSTIRKLKLRFCYCGDIFFDVAVRISSACQAQLVRIPVFSEYERRRLGRINAIS
jgi:hypothetical protein